MRKVDVDKASELLKDLKYSLFTPEFVSNEEAEMLYHTILFWRSHSIRFVDKIFKDRDEQCDELKKEIERLNKIIEEYEDREMFREANNYC